MVIEDLVGQELVSEWRAIEQQRIDEFARATDDAQWIHTDAEQAAAGPFGTTIAHGFLTLSLVVPMFAEAPFARSHSTALTGDGAKPLRAIRTV